MQQPILAPAAAALTSTTATILKEGGEVLGGVRPEVVGTASGRRGLVRCRIATGLLLGNVGLAGRGGAVLLVGCAVGVGHLAGIVVLVRRGGVVVVVAR